MAKFAQLNLDAFRAWVASRPTVVRALAMRLPPDRLYLRKSTGQHVTVYSYGEDGTLGVAVRAGADLQAVERQVFGVSADDLEECELPQG